MMMFAAATGRRTTGHHKEMIVVVNVVWWCSLLRLLLLSTSSADAFGTGRPLTRTRTTSLVVAAPRMRMSSRASSSSSSSSPPLLSSQLEQLAAMTVLSIDSGDLDVIRRFAQTNCITDATTNPLFVAQAGLSTSTKNDDDNNNNMYSSMVDTAVTQETTVDAAMDRLAVELGTAIANLVSGYVSTEVDPRLSFDTEASVSRALRIITMYEQNGISKHRILIKLAATWEGIKAAHILETKYDIRCNLTLVFSVTQAIACAQHSVHLISPFPGRILDWYKQKLSRPVVTDPALDEGVIACQEMYRHYKTYGYDTICMPASWRPSRGNSNNGEYELDEIRALAGTDRMTIPPNLLDRLQNCFDPLPRVLSPDKITLLDRSQDVVLDEATFRYRMTMDGCGNDKLAEGIRAFCDLTEQLETSLREKMKTATTTSVRA
jgi:transaldolase